MLAHTSAVLMLPPSPHFSLHCVYLWASFISRNKQKFKYRVFNIVVLAVRSSLSLKFIHVFVAILLAEYMNLRENLMNDSLKLRERIRKQEDTDIILRSVTLQIGLLQ
jgi:hypothetical protein